MNVDQLDNIQIFELLENKHTVQEQLNSLESIGLNAEESKLILFGWNAYKLKNMCRIRDNKVLKMHSDEITRKILSSEPNQPEPEPY